MNGKPMRLARERVGRPRVRNNIAITAILGEIIADVAMNLRVKFAASLRNNCVRLRLELSDSFTLNLLSHPLGLLESNGLVRKQLYREKTFENINFYEQKIWSAEALPLKSMSEFSRGEIAFRRHCNASQEFGVNQFRGFDLLITGIIFYITLIG